MTEPNDTPPPSAILEPKEVLALLMAAAQIIEDFEKVETQNFTDNRGKQLNEQGRASFNEILAATRSAKAKLEHYTTGGQVISLGPELEPGDTVERETFEMPKDSGAPKLKRLIAEIGEILVQEDVAGVVALHTPGAAEHLMYLTPSYSGAKMEAEAIRLVGKLADFKGDKAARDRKLADTSNMLHLLSEAVGRPVLQLMQMSEALDKAAGSKHFAPVEVPYSKPEADTTPLNEGEYQFRATSWLTLKHNKDEKTSSHVRTNIRLDVGGPIDPNVYIDKGLPTKEGTKPLTLALATGLVANIHMAHEKGWWDSAEHIRYVIEQITTGFASVAYPTEGVF